MIQIEKEASSLHSERVGLLRKEQGSALGNEELQEEYDKKELEQIVELEKGHYNWTKQGINFSLFMALCCDNVLRGSKKTPSIFGIETCSPADWSTLVAYIIFCVIISIYSTRTLRHEQALKVKYGTGLAKSDIYLGGPQQLKLVVFSFFGGWVSGALGLGGGSIFNPLLLGLGCPPKVASSTGMYMMIWSTGASIITMII